LALLGLFLNPIFRGAFEALVKEKFSMKIVGAISSVLLAGWVNGIIKKDNKEE